MEATAGVAGILALVLVVGREIIQVVNHRRIRFRSPCCDKESVASVDIEATTPPKEKPALIIQTPAAAST